MYEYQKNKSYYAQIASELEEEGAKELAWLGAREIETERRGIRFTADKADLYRINYKSRLISRVLAPLVSFTCEDSKKLYNMARTIEWSDFFSVDQSFAIFSNVSDSAIDNSQYASLCLKDAVADSFRDKFGRRPNVNSKTPDVWLCLHIRKNKAVISFDTSGGTLHKRGYRKESVEAPMQETLAAAIIQMTEWDGETPLHDPMCGSGTLLSEALMYACNIPAGYLRSNFGFTYLPDFDKALWEEERAKSIKRIRVIEPHTIGGSDISRQAVQAATGNINMLPHGNKVTLSVTDFNNLKTFRESVIVINPPYGIRLGSDTNMDAFYKSIGDFLKQKCTNSTAYVYFGEREYIKKIGLKASWEKPLKNGGLDGRLVKYELY